MPLFKRFFGQGKSKASNNFVALCIGNYSRIISPIEGKEAHELRALLAHDSPAEEGSPNTSQATQAGTKNNSLGSQTSFRGFRHLIQHLGGGSSSAASSQDGTEIDAQQQLTLFLKNLGGYPGVSFVTTGEDGLAPRDKVLAKLTKLFKHSTAPVVLVSYCGPSDERGNWRLASQAPAGGTGIGSGSGGPHNTTGAGGTGAGSSVLSFREVSMLWQRYRKHSQRLVLLLDCANSGYWVSALRMLSKAEQLELSLGVQASDCSLPATQDLQLTYQPGIFTQFYLVNNKWRRVDPRRNASGNSNHRLQQPQQEQEQGAGLDAAVAAYANASVAGGQRGEQWLPGMLPSYYATWLNDHLVDYGIALRFFNVQVPQLAVAVGSGDGTGAPAMTAGGGGDGPRRGRDSSDLMSPLAVRQRACRANTGPLAAIESSKSLGRPSRQVDEVTSPSSDPWCSPRFAGVDVGGAAGDAGERGGIGATLALRAVSMQESARRRFSSLYYDNCTTDGAGVTSNQQVVGSPNTPTMQRVRLSTPQADWRGPGTPSSAPMHTRAPTLPGDDSLYKMSQDPDGSGSTLAQMPSHVAGVGSSPVLSPFASVYGDNAPRTSAAGVGGGGSRLQQDRWTGAVDGYVDGAERHSPAAAKGSQSLPPPASPPRVITGIAVHPSDVDVKFGSVSPAVAVTGYRVAAETNTGTGTDAGCDETLVIQHRAQSDTAAVAWDRRITHAERCLVDERNGGTASSFSTASGRRNGFANELFGALHEVATDRRLRARRAPLEGDESMDTLMEDADLERRVSAASLPSVMLPRESFHRGVGAGGAGGGRMDSSSSIAGLALPSGAAPPPSSGVYGTGSGTAARGGVPVGVAPTPRTSVLLGMSARDIGVGVGTASSVTQQRQASRLFMMSVASRNSAGQMSVVHLQELAEAGGDGSGENDELSMTESFDGAEVEEAEGGQPSEAGERPDASASSDVGPSATAAVVTGAGKDERKSLTERSRAAADARQRHGKYPSTAFAAAAAAPGIKRAAGKVKDTIGISGLSPSESLELPIGAPEAPPMAPTSLEWPQPADSPAPSPALSMLPLGPDQPRAPPHGRGGGLPSGVSGSALRNLLRQNVSIADSMDLDSSGLGAQPLWQRRPGRFEMAGSESSSFVFGDDQERFNILRQLRGPNPEQEPPQHHPQHHHQQQQQPGGEHPQGPPMKPVYEGHHEQEQEQRQGQLIAETQSKQYHQQQQQQQEHPQVQPADSGSSEGLRAGEWGGYEVDAAAGVAGEAARAELKVQAMADGWLARLPSGSGPEEASYHGDYLLSIDGGLDASIGRQM